MKKYMIFVLCLLLGLSLGCGALKQYAEGSDSVPSAPTAIPITPIEPAATEAPAADPTLPPEQPTEAPADVSASEPDLVFDTATLYGEPISSDMLHEYDLVVVNFWADWCGWCVYEMPSLERIHEEHPNVLILGVLTAPNSMADSLQILADNGITFPTLEPAGTLVTYANRLEAFPTTLFFDSRGNECADPIVGAQDYDGWAATIEGLLP